MAPGMFLAQSGADLLANEQHRRLIHLAFADDDRPVDGKPAQFAAHGVHGCLIRFLLGAAAAQPRGGDRRALRHPHDFERQHALKA